MVKKRSRTCSIQVFMAGDIAVAKQRLRSMAYNERGMCVTITPTDFIYTGGEEAGFVVGIQNYPRFPSTQKNLGEFAAHVAEELRAVCCQKTALIVGPRWTRWLTQKAPAEVVREPAQGAESMWMTDPGGPRWPPYRTWYGCRSGWDF